MLWLGSVLLRDEADIK